MNRLSRTLNSLIIAAGLSLPGVASAQSAGAPLVAAGPVAPAGQPLIQIAILLDTSNSMDGLINQTKSQLWKIVNEFARAKRNGKSPRLEVALYEYGNDSLPSAEGHLRQVVSLTTDLDKISEELFALKTNGGSEFCGQVIDRATAQLPWSKDKGTLKLIFIAGNEPFTQGPVDYRKAAKGAIESGIVVNTIHCGSDREGVEGKWKDGAQLADGQYSFIDSNRQVAHVAAPQDDEISKLGEELNKTYIAYGRAGSAKKERQAKQDMNAASVAQGAGVQRALAKSSAQYKNSDWDLVDAAKDSGGAALESVATEELPAEMQKMSTDERKSYVKGMETKRAELQKKIAGLNKDREAYLAKKQKESAEKGGEDTFDAAVIKAVRSQAAKKAFTFE